MLCRPTSQYSRETFFENLPSKYPIPKIRTQQWIGDINHNDLVKIVDVLKYTGQYGVEHIPLSLWSKIDHLDESIHSNLFRSNFCKQKLCVFHVPNEPDQFTKKPTDSLCMAWDKSLS